MNKPKIKVSASTEIATDAFDSLPTISQEQPEGDFEKEIDKFLNETGAPYLWCDDDDQKEWCKIIARHFAEWGATHLNTRKEETK